MQNVKLQREVRSQGEYSVHSRKISHYYLLHILTPCYAIILILLKLKR